MGGGPPSRVFFIVARVGVVPPTERIDMATEGQARVYPGRT